MRFRFRTRTILISIVVASAFTMCRRRVCDEVLFNFEIAAKAYPDRDSILLKDTVWLSVNASTDLMDIVSGKIIDYSNAENLGTDVSMVELTGNSAYAGAFNKFSLYLEQGKFVQTSNDPSLIRNFLFFESNSNYVFRLGFIPLQSGIFRISWGNAVNVYRKNDKCTKADLSIVGEQTNTHSYFNTNNFPGTLTDSTHMYCFKVY